MKYYVTKPLNVIAHELFERGNTFEYGPGATASSKHLWESEGVAEIKRIWAAPLAKGASSIV